MADMMSLITKPIVMVGGQVHAGPEGSTIKPVPASADMYGALRHAAPLLLEEAAALLDGYWPFESEEGDDGDALFSYLRVLARIREAVNSGALSSLPTLKEVYRWALEVGLAIKNADLLKAAIDGPPCTAEKPSSKYPSRHDPEVQRMANEIVEEARGRGQRRPKKSIVAQMIRDRSTGPIRRRAASTIERQFVFPKM